MKLLARFNMIFLVVFAAGGAVSTWLGSDYLQRQEEDRIFAQARLMTETATAARRYAEEQVKPLIARLQKHESAFLPQTVPTYSAIQLFQYLHKANPQYTYKDAMLDPTNPADRATDWESDLIAKFRSDPSLQSIHQERNSAIGKSVFFASPIIIANTACLECHSSPTHAPVAMIREYGPSNGFGWKLNEIVGVQIVSVPASLPTTMAHQALVKLFIYGALIAIASVLLLDWLLLITVIRPVAKLDHMADQISQGKLTEEIPARGRDEISTLALSFNRMQRSLARAIKLLEKDEPGT